jgi:hypothetical protein
VVPYVGIDFAAYETLKGFVPRQQDGSVKRWLRCYYLKPYSHFCFYVWTAYIR